MKNHFKFLTIATVLTAISITDAQAQPTQDRKERKGPPQEAFDACNDKSTSDACTVEAPKGTLTGTCEKAKRDDRIVCVPTDHKRDKKREER